MKRFVSVGFLLKCLAGFCLVVFACYGFFRLAWSLNASRDLAFLRDLLDDPVNESALFDYLCQSRHWTVDGSGNEVIAFLNKEGKASFPPWYGLSSMGFVFQAAPKVEGRSSTGTARFSDMGSGCFASRDPTILHLSNNSMLRVCDRSGSPRQFRKMIVSFFEGLVQDVRAGNVEPRLLMEGSLRTGFDSFGVGEVSVLCGDSAITQGNKIRGWVNQGRCGIVYASLFDADSGKRIGENKAFRSRQYVGFDTDSSKRFFFEIPLYLDGGGELVNARVDLYSGIDGALLYQTNAVLQTWVR